jgi:hypothetical protein
MVNLPVLPCCLRHASDEVVVQRWICGDEASPASGAMPHVDGGCLAA